MKVFDLSEIKTFPYEKRGKNVFYQAEGFKTRLIELQPNGEMPLCKMSEYVIFVVFEGEATVNINSEKVNLREKHCLISEPYTLSVKTEKGVRLLGIQIAEKAKTRE